MKVGDLVIDSQHDYARGIIIEKIDSSIFDGTDDIYKVYYQKQAKAYYRISSNLKTLKEFREAPNE